MKNFVLIEAPIATTQAFLLLHLAHGTTKNGPYFEPFTHYAKWLTQQGYATNTIRAYSEHVARFIDYVYEATITTFPSDIEINTPEIIYSYQSFLIFGKEATNPIAKTLAYSLNKERLTSQTSIAQTIETSIRWFLEVSLQRNDIKPDQLFGRFYTNRLEYRNQYEVSAQRANSWLTGVIRDALSSVTVKKKTQPLFAGAKRRSRKNDKNPFATNAYPIEHAVPLLRTAKPEKTSMFHRNMCFYSLLAATGARTSEVLQVRMIDIVSNKNKISVYLRNPFLRKNEGLSEAEHNKLSWKGRETELTFMIEPFFSIFIEHLEKYMSYEYNSCTGHNFLFQSANGRPYFAADRSSRDKTFKKYVNLSNLEDSQGISLHSLRHMYGTYVLNYLPVPDNNHPGLPLAYVKILMGHASITSTMKYAKHDTEVVDSYIQIANQRITASGEDSLATIRQEFYENQIKMIQREVERIGAGTV